MKSYMTYLMLKGKSLLRFTFLLGSLFFLSYQDIQATHIVGGDLTYQCLGTDPQGRKIYRFRLTIRRDCQFGAADAPFDNPAAIGMYDLVTGAPIQLPGFPFGEIRISYNASDTLNEQLMSDCSVVTGPVCVETFVYDTIVRLEVRPTGYLFVYQRCCRNGSLTNLLNPLATGMSLVAELTGAAQAECNSSPLFGDFPPVYTCVNSPISFDHSALDLDGDSLVYELCTPFTGGSFADPKPNSPNSAPPYDNVVFRPPYSLSNVMGGAMPLQIDPNTGLLTGTPETIGQFVVGICVTAYKNGVMTGKTRRDFQYNVRMCRDVPIPAFSAPALDCEDLTVVFDNQSLLADEYIWIFDMNDMNSDISTEFEPIYTYDQGGFYDVGLVVYVVEGDSTYCRDTIIHTIGVFDSQIDADFTFDVSSCDEEVVLELTDASVDPDPNFDVVEWDWLITCPCGIFTETVQNPQIILPVDGPSTIFVVLIVTSSNGCTATQTKSFQVQPIDLQFNPDAGHICREESVHLILNGDSTLTYTWDPPVGGDPFDPIVSPDSTTTYCVTVTDGLCEVSDCITVEVQQLPMLAFTYETDCKSLLVSFDNNSTGGVNFHWDFGTGNPDHNVLTTLDEGPVFTFPVPGEYIVTLSSRDGCDVSISQVVTADAITVTFPDRIINCFQDSIELNPGADPDYDYVWSPAEFLDDPNSPNPTAGVENDTKFYVTVSTPGLPGCEIVDSILLIIPDDFTVSAGADVTTCVLDSITLTGTTTPPGDFDFKWTDVDSNVISTENTVVVFTAETDTFFLMATDSLGCSKMDMVIVHRPDPTFDIFPCFSDTAYCNLQIMTLCAASNPGVTLEWFNGEGVLIGEGNSIDVAPGVPACFTVIGTDMLGCEESDTVCLTPTFFNLSITGDQSICLNEVVQLSVTDIAGQALSYLWSTNETTSTITVSPPVTTTYTVTVTNDSLGCTMELTTQVVVNLFDPLDIIITSDPDSIFLGQSAVLSTNQPDHFGYMWSSSNMGVIIESIAHPTVTPPVIPTTYSVTVTNEAGCTGTATFTIPLSDPLCTEEDIFLPNVFTPNGDGYNDVLYVRSNFVSTLDLHIYNRWGQQVFHSNNIANGWNGTFNGERLPPDVYGYYMNISCPNGKTYFEKGNITLLE